MTTEPFRPARPAADLVEEPAIAQAPDQPSSGDSHRWTVLAHILRPQGRKGEVLAELLTDFPERFETQPVVFLATEGFCGTPSDARSSEVAWFWMPTGRNQGRIVLHLTGVDSINAAELLSGLDVIIPEADRLELEDDVAYVSDLIGCTLYDCAFPSGSSASEAVPVGIVKDVHFATTADGSRRLEEAAPLLSVETADGAEVLVPFVKAFLLSLDPVSKRIEMRLPSGLIDVNRP